MIIPQTSDCEDIIQWLSVSFSVSAGRRPVPWEGRCGLLEVVQGERPPGEVYAQSSQQRPQEDCGTSGELSAALCSPHPAPSALTLMLLLRFFVCFSSAILSTFSWRLWMLRLLIMFAASNQTTIRRPSRESAFLFIDTADNSSYVMIFTL